MGNESTNNTENPPQNASPGSTSQQRPIKNSMWPSIKILQPPKGVHSPRPDEHCFTYCSQTIAGRIAQQEPWCRSICIRKVFAHEVRNIAPYKTHSNAQANGEAKYPLPPEGRRLPEFLGGKSDEDEQPSIRDVKYWEEGWYLWCSKSRWATLEKLDLMSFDLERQANWLDQKEKRKRQWEEWQKKQDRADQNERLNNNQASEESSTDKHEDWMVVQPPKPYPNTIDRTVLLHLPPPLPPIYQKIQSLLAPSQRALEILRESFETGAQRQLAVLVWQKAQTREPFELVGNVCGQMWEKWKEGPPDDSDRKDV